MRKVEIKIYGINELSKEAKQCAYDDYLSTLEYFLMADVKTAFEYFEKYGKSNGYYIGEDLASGKKLDLKTELREAQEEEEDFDYFLAQSEINEYEYTVSGDFFTE